MKCTTKNAGGFMIVKPKAICHRLIPIFVLVALAGFGMSACATSSYKILAPDEVDTINRAQRRGNNTNLERAQYHVSDRVDFEVTSDLRTRIVINWRGVPRVSSRGFRRTLVLNSDTPGVIPKNRGPISDISSNPESIPINFERVGRNDGTRRDIIFVRSDTPAGQEALRAWKQWNHSLPQDYPVVWVFNINSSGEINYDGQTFKVSSPAEVVPYLYIYRKDLSRQSERSRAMRGRRVTQFSMAGPNLSAATPV